MMNQRAALIGMGTIGRGWAAMIAKSGYEVAVYDQDPDVIPAALDAIKITLTDLAEYGLLDDPVAAFARIVPASSIESAAKGAFFIQESIPEQVALKQQVLGQIDRIADPDAIISSSCSSLDPAVIFDGIAEGARCIVAHPFNPPHLLPLVELLPSPLTSDDVIKRTRELMIEFGQVPVILNKVVPGYVVNRLQAAVVNEAMSLVARGVISPTDLDLCMTASLGRRWSFLGPFETMDLNADDGVAGYARNFRESYEEIGRNLARSDHWEDQAVEAVVKARRSEVPLEGLKARREWRDRQLMKMLTSPPWSVATD